MLFNDHSILVQLDKPGLPSKREREKSVFLGLSIVTVVWCGEFEFSLVLFNCHSMYA